MKRILTIDGRGLKGALPAAFLAEIEEATGKPRRLAALRLDHREGRSLDRRCAAARPLAALD